MLDNKYIIIIPVVVGTNGKCTVIIEFFTTYTMVCTFPLVVRGLYELTIPIFPTTTNRYWSESCSVTMH